MFTTEGKLFGEHFIQDDTEGENIRSMVYIFSLDLFRRHVSGCSDGASCLGDLRSALEFCQPEVHHFHQTVSGEHDVIGFDVPMDDLVLVCLLQTFCCLNSDTDDLFEFQCTGFYFLPECGTIDIFHDKERLTVGLTDFMDGGDVRVIKR